MAFFDFRDFEEHFIELAAFLADIDHLNDGLRKNAQLAHRGGEGIAAAGFLGYLRDHSAQHDITDGVFDDLQRGQQRYAAFYQDAERSGKATESRRSKNRPEDRQLQFESIKEFLPCGCSKPPFAAAADGGKHDKHQQPVMLKEQAGLYEDQSGKRQHWQHLLEHRRKSREDKRENDHDCNNSKAKHEDGISNCSLDLGAHIILALEQGSEVLDNFRQRARLLADAHHADVEFIEELRMRIKGCGKGGSFPDRIGNLEDHRFKSGVVLFFAQTIQGLGNRNG